MVDKKRKITRHRVSYSCRSCRKRKVKCDKVQPTCGECFKFHEPCIYDTDDHSDHAGLQSLVEAATTTTTTTTQKRKQDSDEDIHVDTAQAIVDHRLIVENPGRERELTNSTLNDTPRAKNPVSGQPGRQQNHGVSLVERHQGRTVVADASSVQHSSNGGDDSQLSDLSPSAEHDETVPSNITLSNIAKQLKDLNIHVKLRSDGHNVLSDHADTSVGQLPIAGYRLDDNTTGTGTNRDQPTLMYELMPSEDHRNAIFRSWLASVYTVLPILDVGEALVRYEAFHQWYTNGMDRGRPNPVTNYMPMIFTIHYGGTMSLSLSALRRWWPGASRRFLLSVVRNNFQKSLKPAQPPTKTVLRAMVMMQYMCRNYDDRLQSGATVAYIIRAAQSLGLHRPSARDHETLESACDRRLWWEIVNLDTATASSVNLPPLLSEHYYDDTLPNDVKDAYIGSPEGVEHQMALQSNQYQPEDVDDPEDATESSIVSIHNLMFRTRALISSVTRKLLSASIGARAMGLQDMANIKKVLLNIDRDIRLVISRIPAKGAPELDFEPISDKSGSLGVLDYGLSYADRLTLAEIQYFVGKPFEVEDSRSQRLRQLRSSTRLFHRWARVALSMLLDQVHCLSYAPFIKNGRSKLWTMARYCALKHCHSFMRKYCSLATNEDFVSFRWTWTTLFQPMHAAMLLLVDVYERPHSREATRSRTLFDEVLSLSSRARNIVGGEDGTTWAKPLQEGGLVAWAMFHQVRAKAWRKAGLDPTVLWTEEDHIRIGIATPPDEVEKFVRSMREDTIFPTGDRMPNDAPENLGPLYRQVLSRANGELQHPSDASVLPDTESHQTCPFATKETTQVSVRRARRDQEVLLLEVEQDWYRLPDEEPNSKMQHVNQLIERIRSAQKQQQKQKQQHMYRNPNSGETTVSPTTTDNNSISRDSEQRWISPIPDNETTTTTNPNQILTNDDDDVNSSTHDLRSPPIDNAFPPGPPLSLPSNTRQEQQRQQQEEEQSPNLNVEIDWEQWDSIFGHFTTGFDDNMDLDLNLE